MVRPSEGMRDFSQGRVSLADLPPAIASSCRMIVYRRACDVLDAGDKAARGKALERVPGHMRGDVEVEARRIWLYRRG